MFDTSMSTDLSSPYREFSFKCRYCKKTVKGTQSMRDYHVECQKKVMLKNKISLKEKLPLTGNAGIDAPWKRNK